MTPGGHIKNLPPSASETGASSRCAKPKHFAPRSADVFFEAEFGVT